MAGKEIIEFVVARRGSSFEEERKQAE